jgi:nucleotide-binding universal stress UspA family protein
MTARRLRQIFYCFEKFCEVVQMQSGVKDILVVLDSYPKPSNKRMIDSAVKVAKHLNSHLSALSFEVAFKIKTSSILHKFGLDNPVLQLVAREREVSRSNATALLHAVEVAAKDANVPFSTMLCEEPQYEVSSATIAQARCRDFTIISTEGDEEIANPTAEAVLFESGRPILIPPASLSDDNLINFETMAIAWDASRAATRAVFDALPLLKHAKQVRVLTIRNDKPLLSDDRYGLKSYLSRYGVNPIIEDVDAKGRNAADVLQSYVRENGVGLLIMGGYGHSRAREFVLGGATKSVFGQPFQWTFLSH